MGKNLNALGMGTLFRGPRGLVAGLLAGIGLSFVMRATAQQPTPTPPAIRFQIAVADPQKIYILDHQSNQVYLFSTNNLGVWEASEGFAITPELDAFKKRNPIPKVNP